MLGQIILRDTNTVINGKKAYIIAGVVSLTNEEQQKLKGEHQYIITDASFYPCFERDLTEKLKGMSIDGALTSPLWRL